MHGGRKRTQPGKALIAAHVDEIDVAEREFHHHVGLWLNGEATPARVALGEAHERWHALAEHESFEVDFPLHPAGGVSRRRPGEAARKQSRT